MFDDARGGVVREVVCIEYAVVGSLKGPEEETRSLSESDSRFDARGDENAASNSRVKRTEERSLKKRSETVCERRQ